MELTIHVDGGARGNPGPAGAGVVIHDQPGGLIFEGGYFLGEQTNNVAEYTALLRALERVQQRGAQNAIIYSDSELLVRQLTGVYQVKSPRLIGLFRQVQMLLLKIPRWSVRHIPREANVRADELANLAMDHGRDVVVFDVDRGGAAAMPKPESRAPAATTAAPTAGRPAVPATGQPAVRVIVTQPPGTAQCPAHGPPTPAFTVETTLPAGLCIHAAHALLPTLLAILNTEPHEFAAIPTLTVRCSRPGCGAVFQLSPVRSPNGAPREHSN